MNERDYFEQFTGDENTEEIEVDDIPAFSPECPECHGFGYTEIGGEISIAQPCERCWLLVGR